MKTLLVVAAILAIGAAAEDASSGECNLKCEEGTRCFKGTNGSTCEPFYPKCKLDCPPDHVCELLQVDCIRAPCFPTQTCIHRSEANCRKVRCPSFKVCVTTPTRRAYCETPY